MKSSIITSIIVIQLLSNSFQCEVIVSSILLTEEQNRTEQNSFISSSRRTIKYNSIKEKIIKVLLLMGWMVEERWTLQTEASDYPIVPCTDLRIVAEVHAETVNRGKTAEKFSCRSLAATGSAWPKISGRRGRLTNHCSL